MIEVQQLTKRYGELTAINNISFSVASGQILGFLGPNGQERPPPCALSPASCRRLVAQ